MSSALIAASPQEVRISAGGANQAQRNGKIIDVVVVLSMTPGKPASANNDDGKGIGHHTENEEERVRKPGRRERHPNYG